MHTFAIKVAESTATTSKIVPSGAWTLTAWVVRWIPTHIIYDTRVKIVENDIVYFDLINWINPSYFYKFGCWCPRMHHIGTFPQDNLTCRLQIVNAPMYDSSVFTTVCIQIWKYSYAQLTSAIRVTCERTSSRKIVARGTSNRGGTCWGVNHNTGKKEER